jgi:GntR family transcriptional regulator
VRELAKELTIAPNTISKAYGELEAQGLIISRAGAGTIVNPALAEKQRHLARAAILERLGQLVRDAAALEISPAELNEWFAAELQQVLEEPAGTTHITKEFHHNE